MIYLLALLPFKNLVLLVPIKILIPIAFFLNFIFSAASRAKFHVNKDFAFFVYFLPFSFLVNGLPDIESGSIYLSIGAFFVVFYYILRKEALVGLYSARIIKMFVIFYFASIFLQINFDISKIVEQTVLVRNENYLRMSGFGYINDNSFLFGLILVVSMISGSYRLATIAALGASTSVTGAMFVGLTCSILFSRFVKNKYYIPFSFFLVCFFGVVFFFAAQLDLGTSFIGERLLSLQIRVIFWSHVVGVYLASLDIWSFLFGCGPACSRQMMSGVQYGTTHSNYVGLLIDYGIVGVTYWFIFLFRISKGNFYIFTYAIAFGVTHEFYYVVSNLVFVYISSLYIEHYRVQSSS